MNEMYDAGYDAGYDDAEKVMYDKVWATAYDAGYREGHWQANKPIYRRIADWFKYRKMKKQLKREFDDIPF